MEEMDRDRIEAKISKKFDKLVKAVLSLRTDERVVSSIKLAKDKQFQESLNKQFIEYVNLYHQSIQNLLEGQREVTKSDQFRFEDGESVEDKMKTFENFLRSRMPKFSGKYKLKLGPQNSEKNDN